MVHDGSCFMAFIFIDSFFLYIEWGIVWVAEGRGWASSNGVISFSCHLSVSEVVYGISLLVINKKT